MRRHLWQLGLAAAFLIPAPIRAQPISLRLDQALEQASARSPSLAAAAKEVQAAEAALRQAGAWRNPEFSTELEGTRRDGRVTTASVALPLELGGKRAARVAAAERGRELASAELSNALAELRSRVVAAFFAVLVAQERVQLAASSREIANRAVDAVGKRVAAGKASPVERTRAQVDLANVQLEEAEARAELDTARFALATQLGDSEAQFAAVEGDAANTPSRPDFSELQARLDAAPSLLHSRIEIERRKALVDVERSKAAPDLSLRLGAQRDNEQGRNQAVLGFSLPLPLFDRNQGAILEAARRAEKAADEHQLLRLRLLTELQEAANRLRVASASLQTLRSLVLPSAQQAFEAAGKGFEAGKFGFIEVMDAQRALLQARARYLNTLSTAHQAAAGIDRIVGR